MTDTASLKADLKETLEKIKIAEKQHHFTDLKLLYNLAAKISDKLGRKEEAQKYREAANEAEKNIKFI